MHKRDNSNACTKNSSHILLNKLGKNGEALKACNLALEINPDSIYRLLNKGAILFRMGRHEEALEHFNKVLDINPKDIRALINKRAVLLKMGR
ncbi:MAG: tetratricopeptide repeat protein, partial [Candidatus Diapherotrites archaeon]|nr:tetratricopeptide repeat protein [Candidatus Diapherotrites archaeon]